ncbi:MAG: hypothetical protein MSA50_11780 [Veillonellaceae bacterium]|nr:hypothetical protein [Veillonellaceae bacterium]
MGAFPACPESICVLQDMSCLYKAFQHITERQLLRPSDGKFPIYARLDVFKRNWKERIRRLLDFFRKKFLKWCSAEHRSPEFFGNSDDIRIFPELLNLIHAVWQLTEQEAEQLLSLPLPPIAILLRNIPPQC